MTTSRLTTAFALAATVTMPAMAQKTDTTGMEIFRQKIKADKKLVVARNLKPHGGGRGRVLARVRSVPGGSASDLPKAR